MSQGIEDTVEEARAITSHFKHETNPVTSNYPKSTADISLKVTN